LDEALAFVADAFRHIRRKASGVPYLTHLLQVAVTVAENGGDEDQMVAALLHDYLEDIPGARSDTLRGLFGGRVTGLVEALSESPSLRDANWERRKEAYVAHCHLISADAKLICASDKLHNAHSIIRDHRRIGPEVWRRFSGTTAQTRWYYRAMHSALADGWQSRVLDELAEAVSELEALE
jgi:(p)ppGpp synthase/HD superfamily hydrolase